MSIILLSKCEAGKIMRKTSISLQELRQKIYRKAKSDKTKKFWGLYVHICKMETLREAFRLAKKNNGSAGIDGKSFKEIEKTGLENFLRGIQNELKTHTYKPLRNRRVEIPKGNGKTRTLGIPTIKDRVVQGALKLILEGIFEADFQNCSYGYRPGKNPADAIEKVKTAIANGLTRIIDVDLKGYFDNIRHHILLEKTAKRISDPDIMYLVKLILKVNGKKGVPQGGVISPLLANIYLNEIDEMFERGRINTMRKGYENLVCVRFADDIVILVDKFQRHDKLLNHAWKRLGEELEKLQVSLNTEKSAVIDMRNGETFNFLGFQFRMVENRKTGKSAPIITPIMSKRSELLRKVRIILKKNWNKSLCEVIAEINLVIRGWVNYFKIGNSTSTLRYIKDNIILKLRLFERKKRKEKGFGWKKWSNGMFYRMGLFGNYNVERYAKVNSCT